MREDRDLEDDAEGSVEGTDADTDTDRDEQETRRPLWARSNIFAVKRVRMRMSHHLK